jgi:SNW domain-containing protein 1
MLICTPSLYQIHINDKFATFAESLYIADRHAREEVRQRSQLQQRIAEKQKEDKEEHLRMLAQRARDERSGIAAPSTTAGSSRISGAPGQASVAYGSDDEDEGRVAVGRGGGGDDTPTRSDDDEEGGNDDDEGETEEERKAARERDIMRRERRQERERELRMSNMGTETRAKVLARAQNRDISEKVALGLAKPTMSKESMMDSRLFNQEQLSGSFGDDDTYNLYDRPLFSGASAAAAIYKRTSGLGDDDEGLAGTAEGIESSMKNDRFGLGQGKFEGSDLQQVRDGPVQFEKDTAGTAADPFGVNAFLDEAKKGAKKHGLDTRDDQGRNKRQRE